MSNTVLPNGKHQPSLNDQIVAHHLQEDLPLSAEQRAERFVLVCRDAASLEISRRSAGLPETSPAPWPESTWRFLAEQTQRARV